MGRRCAKALSPCLDSSIAGINPTSRPNVFLLDNDCTALRRKSIAEEPYHDDVPCAFGAMILSAPMTHGGGNARTAILFCVDDERVSDTILVVQSSFGDEE